MLYLVMEDELVMAQQRINAPTFAYKVLYGRLPSVPLRGSGIHHDQKVVKQISIDKHIPSIIIIKLNDIPEIETRSSCEGYSKERPTYLIIRTKNQNEEYVKKVTNNINKYTNVKAGYDLGNGGFFRICITTNLWYSKNPKKFEEWWFRLPKIIKNSV